MSYPPSFCRDLRNCRYAACRCLDHATGQIAAAPISSEKLESNGSEKDLKWPMLGVMLEADFEKDTLTFKMNGDYHAAAGEYALVPMWLYDKLASAQFAGAEPESTKVADLRRQLAAERDGRMRAEALMDDTRRANESLRSAATGEHLSNEQRVDIGMGLDCARTILNCTERAIAGKSLDELTYDPSSTDYCINAGRDAIRDALPHFAPDNTKSG